MNNTNKIKIAIIGGGETGTAILKQFMKYKFIEIAGVADVDPGTPGIKIAKEAGIYTTKDFLDLAKLGDEVDIIVDAIGKDVIRNGIRTYLQATGNNRTILMPELITLLLDAIINNRDSIERSKHGYQKY